MGSFCPLTRHRTRGNDLRLCQGSARLDIRKLFFFKKIVKHLGYPGEWWSHHLWWYLKDVLMWHSGTQSGGNLGIAGLKLGLKVFQTKNSVGPQYTFSLQLFLVYLHLWTGHKTKDLLCTARILAVICFPNYSNHQKFISPLLSLLQDDTLFTDEDDNFQCQVYELKEIIRGPKQSP